VEQLFQVFCCQNENIPPSNQLLLFE